MATEERMHGITTKVETSHGSLYVTVNFDHLGHPVQCFVVLGKSGGCDSATTEAIGRLITLALQHGTSIARIVRQLRDIDCGHATEGTTSIPDAVAQALIPLIGDNALQELRDNPLTTEDICTECGGVLVSVGGCEECTSCGAGKCDL